MALDLDGLPIDALALAIRPGLSLEHVLSTTKSTANWSAPPTSRTMMKMMAAASGVALIGRGG